MNRKRFLPMLTAFYLLAALFCTPALAVGSVADAVASLTRRIGAVGWPVPLAALVSDTRR